VLCPTPLRCCWPARYQPPPGLSQHGHGPAQRGLPRFTPYLLHPTPAPTTLHPHLACLQITLPFTSIKLSGGLAFLVWKSVYITKQVGGPCCPTLPPCCPAVPCCACPACPLFLPCHICCFQRRHLALLLRCRSPAALHTYHVHPAFTRGPAIPGLQVSFRNRVLILFDWLKVQVSLRVGCGSQLL